MQFSLMHERQAQAIAIVTLEILNAQRIHIYFSIQFCPHIYERAFALAAAVFFIPPLP